MPDFLSEYFCQKHTGAEHNEPEHIRTALAALATLLAEKGLVLGTAESCTGGLLAAFCTSLPGSSRWFQGGVVAYANEVKTALLGVPPALLHAHGAVSREVAEAMSQGCIGAVQAHCAIAVTGIAGPDGGSPEKPVGTVWIATCLHDGGADARCFLFAGDRSAVRLAAIFQGILLLAERLKK